MVEARTKPNRASASVNAMPRNMVVRTMPADSGWRAMAVMALPTTMPMPIPGPIAAAPYPIPAPTAPRPFRTSFEPMTTSVAAMGRVTRILLVLGVHGGAQIDAGQDGEDERL